MRRMIHSGAYPSPKDHRDWLYKLICKTRLGDIPIEGGLEDIPLIIHDQGDLPTCTGEVGAYVQMLNNYQKTGEMVDLSAMFIYKMNKEIDDLPPDINGSTVKATVQTLRLKGVCREILYPSTIANYKEPFPENTWIKGRIMRGAYQHRILAYAKCNDLDDILLALTEKKPVLFSMYLLSNFYKARAGRVPQRVTGRNVGGHAMVALRYNKEEEWVKVVNSWGTTQLTDNGYMYIPFSWFKHNIKGKFPALMDAYTVLDYIPSYEERLPNALTVKRGPVTILVNNQQVRDPYLPPLLINELNEPLVHPRILASVMENMTRAKVRVEWDEENLTLKFEL